MERGVAGDRVHVNSTSARAGREGKEGAKRGNGRTCRGGQPVRCIKEWK